MIPSADRQLSLLPFGDKRRTASQLSFSSQSLLHCSFVKTLCAASKSKIMAQRLAGVSRELICLLSEAREKLLNERVCGNENAYLNDYSLSLFSINF